ncbi:MAG: DUF493 family protein [Legionellales bacterium]|nr:DUF493 family protein [Legionellales bacterium]
MSSSLGLLEFPCDFPIKIVCRNDANITANDIVMLIQPHWPACSIERIDAKVSNQNQYISFTAHIVANSQQQLDAIYQDLSSHPLTILVL